MGQLLKDDFQYYLDHQSEFAVRYEGKYIVIKNRQGLGTYCDEMEAVEKTAKEHAFGTFLMQECSSGLDSTIETFHSRVCFFYMSEPSGFAFTTYFDERKNVLINEIHIVAAYTLAEGSPRPLFRNTSRFRIRVRHAP